MGNFHRFNDPAYLGAPVLPLGPGTVAHNGNTYNRINVTSGGTGSGGSAFADGAKGAGPNVGSYLVAFGEDATSSNANRGIRALAENTDVLDDYLNRPLALPVRTTTATATGTVFSLGLPSGTFVGNTGGYALSDLFSVLDQNDNEIITSSGVKIQVVSITGATVGDGFASSPITVTFSPGIPNGTQYRVYYSSRASLATLPQDALSFIRIRGAQEVDAQVENVFRTIQGPSSAGLAWNATPTSTLWELAGGGLDARYRLATAVAGSPAFNTAGAGSVINRDGPAPSSKSIDVFGFRGFRDAMQALWYADDATQGGAMSGANGGIGSLGFVSRTNRPFLQGEISAAAANRGCSLGSFAEFVERQQVVNAGASSSGNGYATKIVKGATATIGPGTDPGTFVVTLSGGNFFARTVGGVRETAVQTGRDMLRITIGSEQVGLVIRTLGPADTQATVIVPDGGTTTAFATAQVGTVACTVTWFSGRFYLGQGSAEVKAALDSIGPVGFGALPADGGMFLVDPPNGLMSDVTDGSGAYKTKLNSNPTLYVGRWVRDRINAPVATMAWGDFEYDLNQPTGGTWIQRGVLRSDGRVTATSAVTKNNSSVALDTGELSGPRLNVDSTARQANGQGAGRVRSYFEVGPTVAGETNPGIVRAVRYSAIPGLGEKRVQKVTSSGTSYNLDFQPDTATAPTIASYATPAGIVIPRSYYFIYTKDNGATSATVSILLPWSPDFAVGDELDVVVVVKGASTFAVTANVSSNGAGVSGRPDITIGGITYRTFVVDYTNNVSQTMTFGASDAVHWAFWKFRLMFVARSGASPRSITWGCVATNKGFTNGGVAVAALYGTDNCEVG